MPRRPFVAKAGAALLLACVMTSVSVAAGVAADVPPGEPTSWSALPGLDDDDLPAALGVLRLSCRPSGRSIRPAKVMPAALRSACAALPSRPISAAGARAFLAEHFEPRRVAGEAFFTGYYEPVVAGSLVPTAAFATPLLAPPADLVAVAPGTTPGLDPALTRARRLRDGRLAAMPDRAAIEAGALGNAALPLVYVASPADAFFIQVQGSARIRLPDGSLLRLVFADRNGYPYTSIGKLLVQRFGIPPSEMGMIQLRAWIESHGQRPDEAGARLMQENRSFIFFRFDDTLPAGSGPIGGEGIGLTPLRSLAIDRTVWPYGLPFVVDTVLPDGSTFRRLMIAQDTGAGIHGAARADIFFGTGDEAARRSGPVRQPGTLYVLWPKHSSGHGATR